MVQVPGIQSILLSLYPNVGLLLALVERFEFLGAATETDEVAQVSL